MDAQPVFIKTKSAADAAIDGLFGGLAAGVLMILVLVLAGLFMGESPAEVLARFSVRQDASPLTGGLVHLAVSGIYGVAFGLLVFVLPARVFERLPGWLVGLLYGLLLLILAVNVLLPGMDSPLLALPVGVLLAGHLGYGLVLGWRVFPAIFTQAR